MRKMLQSNPPNAKRLVSVASFIGREQGKIAIYLMIVLLAITRSFGQSVSVSDIDAAIATAEQQGRVVAIKTGGLSIPAAMSELASLPVTFRSEIDGWKYDITVMSMDFTATGSRLSVGCKFNLPNSTSAIYFASDNIAVSAKNGFKGEMYILPSTLSNAKNSELSSQALAQLNGKTVFYEFVLPQFSNKLWMGLDETSKVSFSCGAFEKFQLSGFLKSYNEVEQEDETGQTILAEKPYVLTFQDVTVSNWNDMYFSAIPVNGFHDFNYKDLGFHFPSEAQVRIDLSNYQNPPNLPTCSSSAGSYWKGIYFEKFSVRLPALFSLKSGATLPMALGKNLFIDTKGLVGTMLAESVFGLSEGVARGLENSDMSLEKVTANYSCGGRINALMQGDIQLGTCDGSSEKTKIGYVFNYADNVGYTYSLTNSETRKAMGSNVVQLSTGSTLTFGISNGQFSVQARYPTQPVIASDVYKNRICKNYSANLTLTNCTNFVEWNTSAATKEITISPDATSTYSAKCFDKYCISADAAPLTINVVEQLTNPEWNSIPSEFCANESHKLATTKVCEGQIEWKTPENSSWTVINGGDGTNEVETARTGIVVQTTHSYQVRCRLNTCVSSEISKNVILKPAPSNPILSKSPAEEIACTTVTLTASNCTNGIVKWYRPNGQEATNLAGSTQWSRSTDGEDAFYITCKNESSGCTSAASETRYVNVEKCHCTPAAPVIVSNQPDSKVCRGTIITFTAVGCNGGTVNWYNNAGHHKGTGSTFQLSSGNWDRYSATCTSAAGCTSNVSNHIDLEFVDCPYDPPSLTNNRQNFQICYDSDVTLTVSNCAGTVKWYRNNTVLNHNGATLTLTKDSYGTAWTQYHTTCVNEFGIESGKSVYQDIEFRDCTSQSIVPVISGYATTTYCPNEIVNFSSSCSNGASITWYLDDVSTGITANDYALNFTKSCVITVKCTNSAGTVSSNQVILTEKSNCNGDSDDEDTPICNPPTLTSTASSISSGGSSTLTASGCSGTVTWSTGATNSSITVSPTVTTTYTATCTENGCVSKASSITINVNCSSTPNAPTMSESSTICSGESVTISASCSSGTVNWMDNNSNDYSRSVSPTTSTTYNAVCKDASGCTSGETSVAITVNAKPNAPTLSCTNCTITSGSSTDIYMSGCNGTAILSDKQVFAGTAFNVNPTETTTYTATCTVDGCISSNSNEVTITVNTNGCTPPSPPSISKIFKTLTAINCSGTITWSDGAVGNVHVVNPSVSTIYTATCKVDGCTSGNSNTVTVNPNECTNPDAPTISASGTTLTSTGCSGTVTWSNRSTGTSITVSTTGNYSATCTVGNCTSGNSSEIYICIKPTLVGGVDGIEKTKGCGTVTLTGSCSDDATLKWGRKISGTFVLFQSIGIGNSLTWTDINGLPDNLYVKCMLDESCESDEINIPNLIRSDFDEETNFETEPVNKTICSGASTTLNATCTKGLPHWNNDVISETNTVSPTITTSYSVFCENGTCTSNNKSVTVTVNSAPVANLTSTDNNKLCTNSSVTLTASCTNNGEMDWSPDTKVVTTGGTYTVTCTKAGCNSSTASVTIVDERPDMTIFRHSLDSDKELTVNCTNTQNVKWYRNNTLVGNQPVLFTNKVSGTYHATCSNHCGTFTSESVTVN